MEHQEIRKPNPEWIEKVLILTKKRRGRPRKSAPLKPLEHETNCIS